MNRLSVILTLVQIVWRVIINVDRDIIHPLVTKWREEEAKRKSGGGPASGAAAVVVLIACLFCGSCAYVKQRVGLLDDWLQSTQTTTNTPAPASTNLPVARGRPRLTTPQPCPSQNKGNNTSLL